MSELLGQKQEWKMASNLLTGMSFCPRMLAPEQCMKIKIFMYMLDNTVFESSHFRSVPLILLEV
jgi:hypothetical protein